MSEAPAPLFDRYLVVDWSAAGAPKQGADSLWWSLVRRGAKGPELIRRENPRTRLEAMAALRDLFVAEAAAGRRVLAGFDLNFGYPAGAAARLAPGETTTPPWARIWARLGAELIEEGANRSNRQALAATLNAAWPEEGPFWGHGGATPPPGLGRRKPKAGYGAVLPEEFRLCERRLRASGAARPKSGWQLAGAGSVGAQSLTGIAALARLRADPALQGALEVWPFESETPRAPIRLAEIYPSLIDAAPHAGEVKDAAQTRALALRLAELDQAGRLGALFAAIDALSEDERRAATAEEGWILGAPDARALASADLATIGAPPKTPLRLIAQDGAPVPFDEGPGQTPSAQTPPAKTPPARTPPVRAYLKDPAAIYQQSFAIVRREARLSHLPPGVAEIAVRMIHACGMVEIADRLAFSEDVALSAAEALEAGAPILCDCEMVAAGVIRRILPRENAVLTTLNDPRTPDLAARLGATRSAAAVELWRERLGGAVVAIGNAPTALFYLLERLDAGWPRPAAILGFPVGFVGAAESKAALAADPRGAPFLTLRGRRGGSAIASAAVNAVSFLAAGETRLGERS